MISWWPEGVVVADLDVDDPGGGLGGDAAVVGRDVEDVARDGLAVQARAGGVDAKVAGGGVQGEDRVDVARADGVDQGAGVPGVAVAGRSLKYREIYKVQVTSDIRTVSVGPNLVLLLHKLLRTLE